MKIFKPRTPKSKLYVAVVGTTSIKHVSAPGKRGSRWAKIFDGKVAAK